MSEMTPTAEERCRLPAEGAKDYAMILMDEGGRITSWNAGAERILGWAEAEVLGQPVDLIFTPEDRAHGVPAQEIETTASAGQGGGHALAPEKGRRALLRRRNHGKSAG